MMTQNFNQDWKFILGDVEGAAACEYDDASWRRLNVPHDWSVELSFDEEKGEGCTAYLPGGIGWYRKYFTRPEAAANALVYLCFDGVYNHAEVFINGQSVGEHPYGYSPFFYEISSYLNTPGDENVVAVRVDHSRYADSRWYTGSGIYRKVELCVREKLHIPVWGTHLMTPTVSAEHAGVELDVTLLNLHDESKTCTLHTTLYDPAGRAVQTVSREQELSSGERQVFRQTFTVKNPLLWDIESPNRYKAVSSIVCEGRTVQEYVTPFGIRLCRFDPETGFALNGKAMKLKGVCLHHDGGLVGAAVPAGVWRRRLQKLQSAGCNAIRCAHNPPSEEFLDLCDEMGLLVQNEFFDEWDNPKDKRLNMNEQHDDYITRGYAEDFQEWAERDLKNVMLRDRNHPCIIQWSIGNEIEWTYPRNAEATGYFSANADGNYFWTTPPNSSKQIRRRLEELPKGKYDIGETAAKLAAWTREMDTSRPVTANCILPSASYESGYADALDVIGYSYRQVIYDYGHERRPEKPIMGAENLGQWHEWKAVLERDFVAGLFLWTGIDYLGEARNGWPEKGTNSGLLDLAGFEKHSYHMFKSLWTDEPHIHLATQTLEDSLYRLGEDAMLVEKEPGGWKQRLWAWQAMNEHWNYAAAQETVVEVYSNCESVELFLNEKSLGVKRLADFEDRILRWCVPFAAGTLIAKGRQGGQERSDRLMTSGDVARIALTADRTSFSADGSDVVHIEAQLVDRNGIPVRIDEREIQFEVNGACRILGLDNGAPDSVQEYQTDRVVTSQGRCLCILQAGTKSGTIRIAARSQELQSQLIEIAILPA